MKNPARCLGLFICLVFCHCKGVNTKSTLSMLEGNWQLTATEILTRGYKPPDEPVPVPDQRITFNDRTFRLSEKGKEEVLYPYQIREIQFKDEPIRYIMESQLLRGEVHFYGSDSLSIGDKGSCAVITHYRRL